MDTTFKSVYVHGIMNTDNIQIVIADRSHLKALHILVQSCAAEDHSKRSETSLDAPQGLRSSLNHFDVFDSDCAWILIAFDNDQPAGIAVLSRIPKLDARLGFLYLDELHVMPQHRRRGVGKALLTQSIHLTRNLGLAGLRLLARIDNEPARRLYQTMRLTANATMLYQIRFDRKDARP